MPDGGSTHKAGHDVHLTGRLTIDRAEQLKRRLQEAIAGTTDVLLRFDQVHEVDLSFIQLLWAARQHAEHSGVRFRIQRPMPDVLRAELTRAGFFRRKDLVPVEDDEEIWSVGWDRELSTDTSQGR